MSEPNIQDPNINPNLDPPESNYIADDHIPSDQVLKSGTFIDVNNDHHADQNGVVDQTAPSQSGLPESESEKNTRSAAETTTTTTTASNAEPSPSHRKPKRAPEEVAAERPEWLPEGWEMGFKVRVSGQSSGKFDKYYVEPVLGRRFRSKKEVFHFLETGSIRKRKITTDEDAMPSGGHGQKKFGSRTENSADFCFDFKNPPDKVTWAFADASEQTWTPVLGDEMAAGSSKREWAAVFSHLMQKEKTIAP